MVSGDGRGPGERRGGAEGRQSGLLPTGAIGLIGARDAGLNAADYPVTINAVSGYSGAAAYDRGA